MFIVNIDYLLLIVYSLLFIVCCLSPFGYCLLLVVCCLLFVVYCKLFIVLFDTHLHPVLCLFSLSLFFIILTTAVHRCVMIIVLTSWW